MTFNVETKFSATGVETAKRQVDEYGRSLRGVEMSAQDMSAALSRAFTNVGIFGGGVLLGVPALSNMISQAIGAADAVTTLRNRLELATGSTTRAAVAYDELYLAAQRSRTSFTELGSVYSTMARAGYGNMTVVQAIGNAMAVSGGSAEGMRAALVQLGQGMSAGVLRGEELNSVMEQAPRLAQALADGMGVPIGALRRLGEEGELTAKRVMDALAASAPRLAEEVAKSTPTVSQAFTVLGNATTRFIGDADKATGFTRGLSLAITGLADGIDVLGDIIRRNETAFSIFATGALSVAAAGGIMLVSKAVAVVTGAVTALGVALAANPAVLALLGVGAAVGGGVAALRARSRTEEGIAEAIRSLEQQNEASAAAAARAEAGGRTAGAATIRAKMDERLRAIRELKQEQALLAGQGLDTTAEDARLAGLAQRYGEQEQARARVAEITRKLQGEDSRYGKTIAELAQLHQQGALSYTAYVELSQQALALSKGNAGAKRDETAAAKRQTEQLEAEARQLKDIIEYRYEQRKSAQAALRRYEEAELAIDASLKKADEQVAAIQFETQLMQLNNQEREIAINLRQLEAAGIAKGTYAYEMYAKRIREAVVDRERVRQSVDSVRTIGEEWRRMSEQLGQSLTDSLMRAFESGKGFGTAMLDTLRNGFRTLILRPMIQGLVDQVGSLWTQAAGWIGNLLGQQAGASARARAIEGAASTSAANAAQGASGAAAASSWWGWIAVALSKASQDYDDGWRSNALDQGWLRDFKKQGDFLLFPGARDLNRRGILSDKHFDLLTNATGFARVFGRKPAEARDSGITGTFGGGGFTGSSFVDWFAKGGFLRRDKSGTNFGALDEGIAAVMAAGARAMLEQTIQSATTLGLGTAGLRGVTSSTRIVLGADDQANQEAVSRAVAEYGEQLANSLAPMLGAFRRAGESVSETLNRLTALQVFSNNLNQLGGVFSRLAGLSVDAREGFIAMAGGMESLQAQAMGFVQEYYTRDEIAGLKARELQSVLASVGITGDVNTREQFRALVDGADVSTETGRRQLAALLGISGDATQVFDFLQETGGTLSGAAAQAPAVNALGTLFGAAGGQAQIDAINGVTSAVTQVRDAINVQTEVLRGVSGGFSGRDRMLDTWEVVQP